MPTARFTPPPSHGWRSGLLDETAALEPELVVPGHRFNQFTDTALIRHEMSP